MFHIFDVFPNEHVLHIEEWVYAYRHGAEINTNMYVETFHCVLKVVYLDSKQNHCADHLPTVLLCFAIDRAFDRIQKLEKGNHLIGLKLIRGMGQLKKRCPLVFYQFSVQKIVGRLLHMVKDQCACLLHCSSCHVCVHIFSCSCKDAHIHSMVCKHPHIVQETSINQLSKVLPNGDSKPMEFEDLINNREDQDLYEDLQEIMI